MRTQKCRSVKSRVITAEEAFITIMTLPNDTQAYKVQ
jgi:hypothetical protein